MFDTNQNNHASVFCIFSIEKFDILKFFFTNKNSFYLKIFDQNFEFNRKWIEVFVPFFIFILK